MGVQIISFDPESAAYTAAVIFAIIFSIAYTTISVYFVMESRAKVREVDNIEAADCGECEDCCCAFWCNWCTQCQILNHTDVTEHYELGSKFGEPAVMVIAANKSHAMNQQNQTQTV